MNKLLGTAIVGAVLVGGVVVAKGGTPLASPEARACTKIRDLCGPLDESSSGKKTTCEENLADVKKLAGPKGVERSEKCIETAESCAAVGGCLVGGIGVAAEGELLKGLGNALTQ